MEEKKVRIVDINFLDSKSREQDILIPCKVVNIIAKRSTSSQENILEKIVLRMYVYKGKNIELTAKSLSLEEDFIEFIVAKHQYSLENNEEQSDLNVNSDITNMDYSKTETSEIKIISGFVEEFSGKNMFLPLFFHLPRLPEKVIDKKNDLYISFYKDNEMSKKINCYYLPRSDDVIADDFFLSLGKKKEIMYKFREFFCFFKSVGGKKNNNKFDYEQAYSIFNSISYKDCTFELTDKNIYLHVKGTIDPYSGGLDLFSCDGLISFNELSKVIYREFINSPEINSNSVNNRFSWLVDMQNKCISQSHFAQDSSEIKDDTPLSLKQFNLASKALENYSDTIESVLTSDSSSIKEQGNKIVAYLYRSLEYCLLDVYQSFSSKLTKNLEHLNQSESCSLLYNALKKLHIDLKENFLNFLKFSKYRYLNINEEPDLQTLLFLSIIDSATVTSHPLNNLAPNEVNNLLSFLINLKKYRDESKHFNNNIDVISKPQLENMLIEVKNVLNILVPKLICEHIESKNLNSINSRELETGFTIRAINTLRKKIGKHFEKLDSDQREDLLSFYKLYERAKFFKNLVDDYKRSCNDLIDFMYKTLEKTFLSFDTQSFLSKEEASIFKVEERDNFLFSNESKKNEDYKKCIFSVSRNSPLATAKIHGIQVCLTGGTMSLQAMCVAFLYRVSPNVLESFKKRCETLNIDFIKLIEEICRLRGHGELTEVLSLNRLDEINDKFITLYQIMKSYA